MVGEACLLSNIYYPCTPDYILYSRVHVCWSEHSKEKRFDISHKLSLMKTICMKCQILFSVNNKKTTSVCCLLNLPKTSLKLILSILGKSFNWGHTEIFFFHYFSQKTDLDISCKCLQWRQFAKSCTDITCKCHFHLSDTGKLTVSL